MPMIKLEVNATDAEIEEYGEKGMIELWLNILERYASEEYYEPDIAEELRDTKGEV